MLCIVKHIILVGNDHPQLIRLQHRIFRIDPGIVCYIIDICHVKNHLGSQPADMILIHISADMAWMPYARRIRQEPLADKIPVFVFQAPLTEGTLEVLLTGIGIFTRNNQ